MIGRDVSGGRSTGRHMVRIDLLMFPNVRLAEALCSSRLCVRELLLVFFLIYRLKRRVKGVWAHVLSLWKSTDIYLQKKIAPEQDLSPCCVYLSKLCPMIYRINEVQSYILSDCATSPHKSSRCAWQIYLLLFFIKCFFFFLLTHFVFVFIWLYSTDFRAQICQSWLQSELGSLLEINSVPTINAG